MSDNKAFEEKWASARGGAGKAEEKTIFVPKGTRPKTQRQFNLFHYFEFIAGRIEGKNYRTALEVGCGRGTIGLYLNRYLGMEVTLLDSSKDAVELAQWNFAHWGGKGVFRVEDARVLSFPESSFDVIATIGLLEHLEDYRPVLREMYRVLKPGGVLFSVNIPKKKSIQVLNNIFRSFLRFGKRELHKDYYRNTDTPDNFKHRAEEVGFEDVKVFYVNPFPLFTPVPVWAERILVKFYRGVYVMRGIVMSYPFRGSRMFSQAHFLSAKKK